MLGHQSDHEEQVENDEDYQSMSLLKQKYLYGRRRRDSDTSVNTNYRQQKEDLYKVSLQFSVFIGVKIIISFCHSYDFIWSDITHKMYLGLSWKEEERRDTEEKEEDNHAE